MRIITNADDLGISPEVNEAIFELMSQGLVTSATIIANAPAAQDACRGVSRFPRCSFGAHLNLTEFRPLSSSPALATLLNADGTFNGRIRQTPALYSIQGGMLGEICAQVESLIARGVRISHFDSHHHVHTLPWVFPVLKAAQRKYGVRKVRISRNVYAAQARVPAGLRMRKAMFNFVLRRWYVTRTTDAFGDLASFCERRARLASTCRSVEIMLHPGATESHDEMALLRSRLGNDSDFRRSLISYDEL